ncbi:hypothetical protein [Trichococcus flocculiformis]|jgi:hypothetical protein|uniref:hypothetical protein n=1 Tax=Trichococcus flocculiformis TaxID=82803 RepID=UPI003DA5F467
MEGYHQSIDNNTSHFRVAVTNINDFNELIHRAKKEAQQLNNTINELDRFYLNVELTLNNNAISES